MLEILDDLVEDEVDGGPCGRLQQNHWCSTIKPNDSLPTPYLLGTVYEVLVFVLGAASKHNSSSDGVRGVGEANSSKDTNITHQPPLEGSLSLFFKRVVYTKIGRSKDGHPHEGD